MKRIIWAFAAGYFATYILYASVVKSITTGSAAPGGLEILPVVIAGTVCAALLGITLLGWWRYARIVREKTLIASGVASALIIATTTIAYTFTGVGIVLVLLMLRGGVLILAPLVDLAAGRKVRWFCWAALALSIAAVIVALTNITDYSVLTAAAIINIGLYLAGYVVRLPAMTKLAKIDDADCTRDYFVGELLVALAMLVAVPLMLAALPFGALSSGLRNGIVHGWSAPYFLSAFLAGVFYAVLYFFGTFIYLDRRENTFCIPLNRASSLLAGVVGAYGLTWVEGAAAPATSQLIGATLIFIALLFLSPAHHIFEVLYARRAAAATFDKPAL